MNSTYNPLLVAVSLSIAYPASYAALDLVARLARMADPRRRSGWSIGGAAALGVVVWAAHFVGMLAFSLPVPLGHDIRLTGASLAIAIASAWLVLRTVARPAAQPLRLVRLLAGAVLIGAGIAAMHYVGMAALRLSPAPRYNPALVALSVLIVIATSSAALWTAFTPPGNGRRRIVRHSVGALLLGGGIITMYYTGMAAARFAPDSVSRAAVSSLGRGWLVALVVCFTALILTTMTLLAWLDTRFERHNARLSRSLLRANRHLHRRASRDQLTDLPNRATLSQRIERVIAAAAGGGEEDNQDERHGRANRSGTDQAGGGGGGSGSGGEADNGSGSETGSGRVSAVLFMDLDGFKAVNDSLGHAAGDAMLKAFADHLRKGVLHRHTFARLGGDEFVAFAENLADRDSAGILANEVLAGLEPDLLVDGIRLRVSASIGIALFPQDGDSVDELLKSADAAMYSAKKAGRNTWRFFEPAMSDETRRVLLIRRTVHEALPLRQLLLRFQPAFTRDGRALRGVEVLVCWEHPALGLLEAREFVAIAKRSGHIAAMGYWAIRETCQCLRLWRDAGLPAVTVAIGLAPQQLWRPDLLPTLDAILRETGVAPQQLMFNVFESVTLRDPERSLAVLEQLHARGFEIALDNVGSGYSSLAYLRRFPLRQLKIHGGLTRDVDAGDGQARGIVAVVVALAHALGMEVAATDVAAASQLGALAELACDQVQGPWLAPPLTQAEFEHYLGDSALHAPPSSAADSIRLVARAGALPGIRAMPLRARRHTDD